MVPSKSQPLAVQPPAVRPLSSTDETGPAAKKLRSTAAAAAAAHQRAAVPAPGGADKNSLRPSKSAGAVLVGGGGGGDSEEKDDRTKVSKARARPALTIANIFSSPGRRAQHAATSSRSSAQNNVGTNANAKEKKDGPGLGLARRSSRLMGTKQPKVAAKVGLSGVCERDYVY